MSRLNTPKVFDTPQRQLLDERPVVRASARLLFAVAVLALAVVYAVAWRAPSVGLYHDDGIYLVTAKALAEGKGYRILSLPQEIVQTKYPPVFPVLLAAAWKLRPDFPGNVAALKAVPVLFALVWFALAFRLLLRLGATRTQAYWLVLLTAAAPLVIFCSTNLLSETLFASLLTATLLSAGSVERSKSDRGAYAAGLLAALAFLTRTAGVALFIGVPAAFLLRRRWGAAWRFAAASAAACTWPVWVRLHSSFTDEIQAYYSAANYASWNILSPSVPWSEKMRILTVNSVTALASPLRYFNVPAPGLAIILIPVLLAGLALRRRWRADAAHLVLAVYTAVVLCWAWPPDRFLLPILPVLLLMLWNAVTEAVRVPALRWGAVAGVGLLSGWLLAVDLQRVPLTIATGSFPLSGYATDKWADLQSVYDWIERNTTPDAVVLANLDPSVYLYTGRKSTRNFVGNSSYKLIYAPDAPTADAGKPMDEIIEAAGASLLLMTPDKIAEAPVVRRALAAYVKRYPEKLELVDRPGADPAYRVYRIHR
jgi:hypothetical protein